MIHLKKKWNLDQFCRRNALHIMRFSGNWSRKKSWLIASLKISPTVTTFIWCPIVVMRVEYLFKKVRDNRSLRTIFTFNYIQSIRFFVCFLFCKGTSYCLFWYLFYFYTDIKNIEQKHPRNDNESGQKILLQVSINRESIDIDWTMNMNMREHLLSTFP